MTQSLGEYPLLNRHTSQEEISTLRSPIGEKCVDDFEKQWRPVMEAKFEQMTSDEQVEAANLQDLRWNWRGKQQERSNRFEWESFSVECNGETQGLMFIKTVGFAREESQRNLPLVYIDLVSVAPWNRYGFTDNPKYKGIGPLLMGTALSLSMNEGFEGRLGLNSLPQSESWYRDVCKMSDLGPDYEYPGDLVYFEFTALQAKKYLEI